METITRFVLAHKRLVLFLWLALAVAGGIGAGSTANRLSKNFSLPGQPSYETGTKIAAIYGSSAESPPVVPVVTLPAGRSATDPATAAELGRILAAARLNPAMRVVDYANTGDHAFVTANDRTTFGLVFTPGPGTDAAAVARGVGGALRAAAPPGWQVQVTGLDQLADGGGGGNGHGVLFESMLGAVGALVILAVVFASFLALLPLLIAAVSILTTFLLVLALTTVTDVSFIVQFLIALIGLGVAIDYSLIVVTRWREERAHGRDNVDAVRVAMATAGHAVVFSGLTVAIGLLALIVLPVPFLRSVGIGGALIPLVSIAVSITLLPVLLATVGPRLDWPRLRHEGTVSRPWSGWARLVVRRRWAAALAGVAILAALAVPALQLNVGEPRSGSLAQAGEAHNALQTLAAGGVPTGLLTPVQVLTRGGDPAAVAARIRRLPGITAAVAPRTADFRRAGTTLLTVLPRDEASTHAGQDTVRAVRAAVAGDPSVVGVTGGAAGQLDFSHAVYGSFPLMLTLIALLTFVLLTRAFRSLLLAAKAVLLNLISLAAAYGSLTLIWQQGHGSNAIWGIPATGSITMWVPVMVFAFLFGLSMDYEVFILSRIREEYDRTGSTSRAVVEGLGRTGRLVTCAALILVLSFLSLSTAPGTDLKILSTGLGVGILVDATVIRALLAPALVSLFGRWNWWLPAPVARLLRVPAGTTPAAAVEHREAVSA